MKKQASTILGQGEETDLIKGLINNDDAAYELLVRQYSAKMYAVACRFFNETDDAQECLQKAFIQVFKNISSFNKNASLMTWLHRITVNEALMMIRQKKRQNTTSLEDFTQHYNEDGDRTVFTDHSNQNLSSNIEKMFEQNEMKLSLNEIIYQLPEKYCNVLLFRDIQGLTTKETAEILAISEGVVKTQLHRARLLLKAVLEQKDMISLENNWKVK